MGREQERREREGGGGGAGEVRARVRVWVLVRLVRLMKLVEANAAVKSGTDGVDIYIWQRIGRFQTHGHHLLHRSNCTSPMVHLNYIALITRLPSELLQQILLLIINNMSHLLLILMRVSKL